LRKVPKRRYLSPLTAVAVQPAGSTNQNRVNSKTTFSDYIRRIGEFIAEPAHSETAFNSLALELFTLQFEHNHPYRRLCDARGAAPDTVSDWTEIPALPTAAFKEWEVTSIPPNRRAIVFHSSGTSNQTPSRHFHDPESLALYILSIKPWFALNVLSDATSRDDHAHRFALLTPPPWLSPNSSLTRMLETVRIAFGSPDSQWIGTLDSAGAWSINTDLAIKLLDESIATEHPLILLGTAFSFVHLIDHLDDIDREYDLPPGSRVMETGGYKGRSRELPKVELHRLISQRLGIPQDQIIREYGMSELSSQAYASAANLKSEISDSKNFQLSTQTNSQPFHFPPWARARIVSPETGQEVAEGETGLIRVVDLANVRSVAAIQTEDLGVRRGDGFELLGRAALAEPRGCSRMTD